MAPKELKLCMSTRAMTRSSLHNRHMTPLRENPKQHVAHFVETCNNASADGDLLVKQFVCSLRGNAFDWYINLAPECIDS
ncbi:hypothetical protein PVL29_006703 [Vitis rotundifolia]|uniref:Retrotransposon gag domain-containing protein n=1 Tax=Vitis rotundifolia TaxID=103349 RepID=A0AA39A652_VITRO|nr:hypothetical protein PVL29_006703 [Vitis rotundifolia]